ncbi:hypothetical protein Vadar_006718 [Vaccinium darrowii]|uniref:Uncharacterized protein n=1 Tax=Vaccinium darrowii TaxID=229202 RepID=A0ACB7XNT2_9ERIC|nr:hypothetical protein Vadar_006718 [Vaccinium darrowii]
MYVQNIATLRSSHGKQRKRRAKAMLPLDLQSSPAAVLLPLAHHADVAIAHVIAGFRGFRKASQRTDQKQHH